MSDAKSTKLNIREDRPTAVSSTAHDANVNSVGFNLPFIALRNPRLAVEIMKLYALAHRLQADDPQAPEEDYALFADEAAKMAKDSLGKEAA